MSLRVRHSCAKLSPVSPTQVNDRQSASLAQIASQSAAELARPGSGRAPAGKQCAGEASRQGTRAGREQGTRAWVRAMIVQLWCPKPRGVRGCGAARGTSTGAPRSTKKQKGLRAGTQEVVRGRQHGTRVCRCAGVPVGCDQPRDAGIAWCPKPRGVCGSEVAREAAITSAGCAESSQPRAGKEVTKEHGARPVTSRPAPHYPPNRCPGYSLAPVPS